jgi:DNA-nicking Smr family endonuclease
MAAPPELELVPLAELRNKPDLNIGDTLMVCKKGMFKGKQGTISEMGNQITLMINGMSARFKYQDLALVPEGFSPITKSSTNNNNNTGRRKGSILSKRDIQAMEDMSSSAKTSTNKSESSSSGGDANKSSTSNMRLDSNTIDVRGSNLEEAKRTCTAFFGRATMSNRSVVYILHGHGTGGVLKQKVRDWLRSERQWVKRYAPADAGDGGDAFTLVELKKLKLL